MGVPQVLYVIFLAGEIKTGCDFKSYCAVVPNNHIVASPQQSHKLLSMQAVETNDDALERLNANLKSLDKNTA